ncbi:uncharacterized protein [Palaemon carinicauda]|uniref:uncharacterized protein n=1 Tax=Palaemon carinicauda TaxID=392227 RepID=UPI0035B5CAFF
MRDVVFYLFLAIIWCLYESGECLRITELTVPRLVRSGSRVNFSCAFELIDEELYSLTWWKDNQTFFSYLPSKSDPKMIHNVPGITVDKQISTLHEVFLSQVDHRASGTIRCEVLVFPKYEQATKEANFTVIAQPVRGPSITGHQGPYQVGDLLLLNCSSPPSYPPTTLSWDIDGRKASQETVILYPGETDSLGRVSSWSGLQMWLNHHHFSRGILVLRCTASILDNYSRSSEIAITSADYVDVVPRERASTGGAETLSIALFLLLLLLLASLAT